MPGGALVGTVVHGVFEHTEFDVARPGVRGRRSRSTREVTWRNVDLGSPEAVVRGTLRGDRDRPSDRWSDGIRLRDIARADRLDELSFEIPLVGGDAPTASLQVACGWPTSSTSTSRRTTRWRATPPRLRDPALGGVLRGYLTGSLDLVFRLPGDRFFLADYKTNKLAAPGETLTVVALPARRRRRRRWWRRTTRCRPCSTSVALHRYLRWRLHDYDPDAHLGGVLYLFVRGMSAADPMRGRGAASGRLVLAAAGSRWSRR